MSLEKILADEIASSLKDYLIEEINNKIDKVIENLETYNNNSKYNLDSLLTDVEVAEFLSLNVQTIRHWRNFKNNLEYYSLGNKIIRYKFSDVLKFALKNKILVSNND